MAKEINILLLGETAVGKSTFINAFANYLNHETMEDAKSNPICLIPSRFVITDENYETKHVEFKLNTDRNESYEKEGESVTQHCRTYVFNYGEIVVRLIDTPGVGDTRGIEQDKKNFENLLSFIAEYEELHLICILFKPDMHRLTDSFNYCVKQLLYQLHKDAKDNIVFLFTNGRSSFYRPKNTIILLKEVLKEIKSGPPFVDIPLNKNTMYCLDNDSFQLLIALLSGINFSDDEVKDYSSSWEKSVKECMRLMNYIISGKDGKPLPPHSIQNILSINETRRLILALNGPIVNISRKLNINMYKLNKERKELEKYCGDIKAYLERIKSNTHTYELSIWDLIPIYNIFSVPIKTVMRYEAKRNREKLMEQLTTVEGKKKVKEEMLEQIQETINVYNQEKKKIVESSAKFALFLKNNAIATYNDAYRDLLLKKIENVGTTRHSEAVKEKEISNINRILKEYENEKKILDENIERSRDDKEISLERVNTLIKELYELKYTGSEIKKLHEESKSKQSSEKKVEVHQTNIKSKTGFFSSMYQLMLSK